MMDDNDDVTEQQSSHENDDIDIGNSQNITINTPTEEWLKELKEILNKVENLPELNVLSSSKKVNNSTFLKTIEELQMVINASSIYMQCIPHFAKAIISVHSTVNEISTVLKKELGEMKLKISELENRPIVINTMEIGETSAGAEDERKATKKSIKRKFKANVSSSTSDEENDERDAKVQMTKARPIMKNPKGVDLKKNMEKVNEFKRNTGTVSDVAEAVAFEEAITEGGEQLANQLSIYYRTLKPYEKVTYNYGVIKSILLEHFDARFLADKNKCVTVGSGGRNTKAIQVFSFKKNAPNFMKLLKETCGKKWSETLVERAVNGVRIGMQKSENKSNN